MTILPINWVCAPIGSLCDLKNGRAFKPTEWSQDGLPIVRIQNLNKASAPFNRFNGTYDHKHYLKGGELLFAWSGTPGTSFGAHVWRGGEALLNQHIFRVDFDDALLDRRYFRHAINQKLAELIGVAHGGAGLQHVTKGVFEGTEVALPPRTEQKRIADKLDTVLTRVDAVNTRLVRVAPLLRRFRQSVLAAATSGRLTEDWRLVTAANDYAAPSSPPPELSQTVIPPTWTWKSVSEISIKVTDGVHKKPTYLDKGVPFLTVGNLTAGPGIDFATTRFVSEEDHAEYCKRTHPERDDILITKDGTLGVVRRIDTDQPFSIFVSLALVKLIDKRQSPYVSIAFASPHLQIQMKGVGTGLQHIHLTDLRKDLMPIPPLDEQAEIVRRVETLFAFADRLEARLQTAQTAANRLTPSLLAKAFRGELVPQDPNDEPASELLKRLAASTPVRPTKRGRAKSTKAV